jgi:hemerythrin-like domain-containing protein
MSPTQTKAAVTPTGILMSEHRVIEKALACLERMADGFEAAGALNAEVAGDALEFLRTFADRCHHGKEEANLFPAMESKGLPVEVGPTAVMREEHRAGRGHVRDMGDALARGSVPGFVGAARAYVELLREHIQKEDQVLFPMADKMLAPPEQDALLAAFERVEDRDIGPGVHERMLGIADRLCARYGVTEVPRAAAGGCGHCCGGGHA